MGTIDRIYEYIDYKRLKISHVERECGLSNGYLASQKKRGSDVGSGILSKIVATYPDLDANWLLTGKGSMIEKDPGGLKEEIEKKNRINKGLLKGVKERGEILDQAIEMLESKNELIEKLQAENEEYKALLKAQKKEG